MEEQKSILFVITKPPYHGQAARESLDAILTAAAFETPLAVLFLNDGVYQLLAKQSGERVDAKNLASSLAVLPIYDVEHIYADADALNQRGLAIEDLEVPAKSVDIATIKQLFDDYDKVLSF